MVDIIQNNRTLEITRVQTTNEVTEPPPRTLEVSKPGPQGEDGPPGDDGPPGVVAATSPITYDSLTQTVGLDSTGADDGDTWRWNASLNGGLGGWELGPAGSNLTFGNGLTRTGDAVALGGSLTADTTITTDGKTLTIARGNQQYPAYEAGESIVHSATGGFFGQITQNAPNDRTGADLITNSGGATLEAFNLPSDSSPSFQYYGWVGAASTLYWPNGSRLCGMGGNGPTKLGFFALSATNDAEALWELSGDRFALTVPSVTIAQYTKLNAGANSLRIYDGDLTQLEAGFYSVTPNYQIAIDRANENTVISACKQYGVNNRGSSYHVAYPHAAFMGSAQMPNDSTTYQDYFGYFASYNKNAGYGDGQYLCYMIGAGPTNYAELWCHVTEGVEGRWITTGNWTFDSYPNTRDDSGTVAPVNFLYTGPDGKLYSGPTDLIQPATKKYARAGDVLYLGTAPYGTATSAAEWYIARVTYVSGVRSATAHSSATAVWDNYLTETYT